MYTFMSLKLYTNDIDTIDQLVADKVQQAPGFFKDTPVVVDLTELDVGEHELDASVLLERIRKHKLVPIVASVVNKKGELAEKIALPLIEGVARRTKPTDDTDTKASGDSSADDDDSANKDVSASGAGSKDLNATAGADNSSESVQAESTASAANEKNTDPALELSPLTAQEVHYIVKQPQLMVRPVRSGQQVYARETDLIVMGQVGAGAEVIADNHIHVYGALRGRALCGVSGNTEARIFCQSLEAELVSVAGNFRVLESIPEDLRGKPAQIWLDKERLNIEPL